MREEFDHIPWLPLSVIIPPGSSRDGDEGSGIIHTDREANLNVLLGTLGPSEGKRLTNPMGEAMGGTVSSVRLNDSEKLETEKSSIQLQRVAPRCHCQVVYVTYGDQVEAEIAGCSSPRSRSVSTGERIVRGLLVDKFLRVTLPCTREGRRRGGRGGEKN